MDIYTQMVQKIIKQQEAIIGPIALEQAKKISGLKIDGAKNEITIEGNQTEVIEKLIQSYEHLFGKASVEVCRDAVKGIIGDVPKEKLPKSLQ